MYEPLLHQAFTTLTFLACQLSNVEWFVIWKNVPAALAGMPTVSTILYCITLLLLYTSYTILTKAESDSDLSVVTTLFQYATVPIPANSALAVMLTMLLVLFGSVVLLLQLAKTIIKTGIRVKAFLIAICLYLRYVVFQWPCWFHQFLMGSFLLHLSAKNISNQ